MKAVLAATHYDDHKEVVAKLVLESSTEVKERQVLAYKAQYNSRRGRGRKFQNNNRGQSRNYYQGGQGQNQGNSSRGYNRTYNNYYRGRGYNSYNGNDNRSVRVIEASGNSEAPPAISSGGNAALMPYRP